MFIAKLLLKSLLCKMKTLERNKIFKYSPLLYYGYGVGKKSIGWREIINYNIMYCNTRVITDTEK